MDNGIFTKDQYQEAIRHYDCVAAELSELADHFTTQADRITLEKAADLLRGLANSGRVNPPPMA